MNGLTPVAASCLQRIGDPNDPVRYAEPAGYPGSLALCIIDSIQSTGVRYTGVVRVLNRYRAVRASQGCDASTDGAEQLLGTFDAADGVDGWAAAIGTRNVVSTHPGAVLKAAAVRAAAETLRGDGIDTAQDLRSASSDPARAAAAETLWRAVPGQRSGVTWHYVQMLAGVPGVKPDRMILRFVAAALGTDPRRVSTSDAVRLVSEAAAQLGVSATGLDHAIWRYQRRRPGTS